MVSKPHGGKLVYRVARGNRRERLLSEIDELPKVIVDMDLAIDLENIAVGIYSPLTGFMMREDFEYVIKHMRLSNDLPWTMPIILDVSEEEAKGFREGDVIAVYYEGNIPMATMVVDEIYDYDKRMYAENVFKTIDSNHPGVSRIYRRRNFLLGGDIELINYIPNPYERFTLRPFETRVLFRERGWRTIVGFQTRNAPHMGHEYVQKTALAFVDGLFINPVIGKKKRGDFRDDVILSAYETLIKNYYPWSSVVLGIVRYEMKYAGPREAVHHAIMRKNFGCTHFIVGRDHAGVGNYYKPYEAQEIFSEFPDLGITPLFFREFFYCRKCGGIVHDKICPHSEEYRIRFSGTMIRKTILENKLPSKEMMRPEVAKVILGFEKPFVE